MDNWIYFTLLYIGFTVTLLGQTGLQTYFQTGLLRRTGLLGLTLLWLWQTLLEQKDLMKLMFLGQTGLLRLKFFEIIGLLGQTLFKHAVLVGQIGLIGQTLLEQTLPLQMLTGSDRDLWERALTSLEKLHAVANDNEAATE